jgi:hypothetical protein
VTSNAGCVLLRTRVTHGQRGEQFDEEIGFDHGGAIVRVSVSWPPGGKQHDKRFASVFPVVADQADQDATADGRNRLGDVHAYDGLLTAIDMMACSPR